MELHDKVILVTGAVGGIGSAIVSVLQKEYVHLILHTHDGAVENNNDLYIKADLDNPDEIKLMFDQIKEKFGRLDVLINTVGIEESSEDQLDSQKWLKTFQVNLFGAVECARYATKLMDNGVIINISSIAGNSGVIIENSLAYSVSKAALQKFSENLAMMLAPKIRVVSISPGYTLTSLWDGFTEEQKKEALQNVPNKRFITPLEIAEFIVEIVKNDAITGINLTIDGGLRLKSVI